MHRTVLEDGAKDVLPAQRSLNPTLKEVVMKKMLKLNDVGIIYTIFNNMWVSPIHVVPKKIRMVVYEKGEMVPTKCKTDGGCVSIITN